MSDKIRQLKRLLDKEMSEEITRTTHEIRAKYGSRNREIQTLCEQETSHEWKAERLNDYNISHLQRFGSTPQQCVYCHTPRPLEQYSDLVIKQEDV